MKGQDEPQEFPNVSVKLAAPKKISAFEREKQAAEAKRRAEEAATAAELKRFEESFGIPDDDGSNEHWSDRRASSGPRHVHRGGLGGRAEMGNKEFPNAPPKRRRALDEMREAEQARRGLPSTKPITAKTSQTKFPLMDDDDDEEDNVLDQTPLPTIHLSSLPPAFLESNVEELLQGHLTVKSVQMVESSHRDSRARSAIVSLDVKSTKADIDTTITKLRSRYLGFGYYLKLSRHLSSAIASVGPEVTTSTRTYPYGAEASHDTTGHELLRNAPPPPGMRNFAPPESFETPVMYNPALKRSQEASVNVRPPQDIGTVRAIHTIADRLLSESDPARVVEIEAMLMAQPVVQKDERFAFLFDATSPAGVYYRYVLWSPYLSKNALQSQKQQAQRLDRLDEGYAVGWSSPHHELPFSNIKDLGEVIADEDYVSSDEEEDEDKQGPRFNTSGKIDLKADLEQRQHLRPLRQARLVHLLCRIPQSTVHLRTGDVARVTHFAIRHAAVAAEEITDLMLINLIKPLSSTLAAEYEKDDDTDSSRTQSEPEDLAVQRLSNPSRTGNRDKRDSDPSASRINGLYLISDLLNSSHRAGGAKNAWKYPKLFEAGFRAQRIFWRLGRVPKELQLGRMKAEQWKVRVSKVLEAWEMWRMFSREVHEEFRKQFLEPEPTWQEMAIEQAPLLESRIASDMAAEQLEQLKQPSCNRPVEDINGKPTSESTKTLLSAGLEGLSRGEDGSTVISPAPSQRDEENQGNTDPESGMLRSSPSGIVPKPSNRRMRAEDF